MDGSMFDFSQEAPLFRAQLRRKVLAAAKGALSLDDDLLTQVNAAGELRPRPQKNEQDGLLTLPDYNAPEINQ